MPHEELNQHPHARHPDGLAAGEWLAVGGADALAPVGGFIAKLIQERRRSCRPAFDELAVIAGDRSGLPLPIRTDVQYECRLGGLL